MVLEAGTQDFNTIYVTSHLSVGAFVSSVTVTLISIIFWNQHQTFKEH